jgi:predicted GNAT family acetyltransferase
MTDTKVVDDVAAGKFDIIVDGELADLAAYRRDGSTIELTHTEIDPKFSGRGLGSVLVRHALDAAREEALAVRPLCPFVRGYIQRHRQYVDLVPADERRRFGLAE